MFSSRLTPILFTITIFTSASLLFFVQPLFAKIVLPHIGGTPGVWTTAMLFFQTALIAGYLYAHLLTKYAPVRLQILIHAVFWVTAVFFLPLAIPDGWIYDASQPAVSQTLLLFALGVGLPFTALSANAPLIQAWYAKSNGPSSDDPYFLYGASNLGSLIALLAFPLVAEPIFGATKIGLGWAIGFVLLGFLLAASGLSISAKPDHSKTKPSLVKSQSPKAGTIIYWIFVAFIPSSLMLAVTTKVSTDIGSLPLFWVIPLALYLLSFVFTFRKRPLIGTPVLRIIFLIAMAPMVLIMAGLVATEVNWASVAIMIVSFFIITVFIHQKLYESRPSEQNLTLFYLVMSIGGALGGVFNSILAPIIFDRLHEGLVTVFLALLLFLGEKTPLKAMPMLKGVVVGAATITGMIYAFNIFDALSIKTLGVSLVIAGGLTIILLRKNIIATFIGMAAVMSLGYGALPSPELFLDRSFFGQHRILDKTHSMPTIADSEGGVRIYFNGSTVHGAQRFVDYDSANPRPTTYYDRAGPIQQAFTSSRGKAAKTVGIVGLGVGVMACNRIEGQDWHFYEIDKKVDDIARDETLFTFMSACAGDAPTHLGDARMVLARQDIKIDLLMIDAYSSDAVPVHLSTIEAIKIYMDHLAPGGMIVFHLSNRYYRIDLPIIRAAEKMGLATLYQHYGQDIPNGKLALTSVVLLVGRTSDAFGEMADDPRWEKPQSDGGAVWTDDYANPLSILR